VSDLSQARDRSERIRRLESAGDDLTHRIVALLNTTFVTPVDRQDIHQLASSLDDVLDAVEAVSDLIALHRIKHPIPQFRQQVAILVGATEAVARAVRQLRPPSSTDGALGDIMRFERDGDHVYRRALAALYSGDYKAMDVLKWRDILEAIETAIDRCEDIANTVESILVKQD
jgi:predicted phosphate transport protein (TIGR00153 family)